MIKTLQKDFLEKARGLETDFPEYRYDEPEPEVLHLANFKWRRVATQGTGNGGFWVATKAKTPTARRLMEDFYWKVRVELPRWVSFERIYRLPKFWELADTLASLTEETARLLASASPVHSWRAAAALGVDGLCPTVPRLAALQEICCVNFKEA